MHCPQTVPLCLPYFAFSVTCAPEGCGLPPEATASGRRVVLPAFFMDVWADTFCFEYVNVALVRNPSRLTPQGVFAPQLMVLLQALAVDTDVGSVP